MKFFQKIEKKAMAAIIRLVTRYYLKKPDLNELISIKIPNFKAGLFALINEIYYLLCLERGFRLTSLSIEVTNHCNLDCLMCPASKQMKREKGYIDEELFRKIIDNNSQLEFILPFQWGEPFLHPKLFALVKEATTRGIRTMITTNGTICSDEIIEQILDSGIERLTFSVDGVGSTYTRLRGFDYNQFKANILKFKKIRNIKKSNLKIDISMVVFEETEVDLERLVTEWKGVVEGIHFVPKFIPGERKKRCHELWRGNLLVLWDGRVVPCCVDFDGRIIVGDAQKESLSQIWNGKNMRRLRRLHRQGRFPQVCDQCEEYRSLRISSRFS